MSPIDEIAFKVEKQRTRNPSILAIDVLKARSNGTRFYKATDKAHLCQYVPNFGSIWRNSVLTFRELTGQVLTVNYRYRPLHIGAHA